MRRFIKSHLGTLALVLVLTTLVGIVFARKISNMLVTNLYAGSTGGTITVNDDFALDGATAGYDIQWDRSEYTLEVLDNAIIAIGTGDDLTIAHDGTNTTFTGNILLSGTLGFKMMTETVTADDTITAAESGKVFVVTNDTDGITLTLPGAAAGLCYWVIDANCVAGSDVVIDPATGDSIDGSTAGDYITCTRDVNGCSVFLIATDATNWYSVMEPNDTSWTRE